jgi:hypothetical protein
MTVTTAQATPSLRVVSQPATGPLLDTPEWYDPSHITDEAQAWLKARWHADEQVVIFTPDGLAKGEKGVDEETGKRLNLAGLSDRLVSEILINLMADHDNKNKMGRRALTTVVNQIRTQQVTTITDLDRSPPLDRNYRDIVNRWLGRPWHSTADDEWEKGRAGATKVRLAVVSPHPDHRTSKMTFDLPSISQSWLRHMTADVLNYNITTGISIINNVTLVTGAGIVSTVLAQRRDKGNEPAKLTRQTMKDIATYVKAHPRWKPKTQVTYLKAISALINTAQTQGFAAPYHLPVQFSVNQREDMPDTDSKQFVEKGLSNACFTLVMGEVPLLADDDGVVVDWGFGSRTLDFAASIPSDPFQKRLFPNGIRIGGNHGRRPTETLSLPCNRVVYDDHGRACLIYDDFKNRVDSIPLPIDSSAAEHIMAWQKEVQAQYPNTHTDDLKLFPRDTKNPDGTEPITSVVFTSWWMIYIYGLEQAIIAGKLWHAAHTVKQSVTIEKVLALSCKDITATGVRIDGKVVKLDSDTRRMLTDYAHDMHARLNNNQLYKETTEGDRPLFPHPTTQRKTTEYYQRLVGSVPVDFYEALGDDAKPWWERAAEYKSHGLPATHFGEGRMNPNQVKFKKMRHTYLQQLVNCGTDIFIVSQLANHANVAITVQAYVSAPQEAMVEAAERLAKFRSDYLKQSHITDTVWLGSVGRNTSQATQGCLNGDVHDLGMRGCNKDGLCVDCNESFYDPSHLGKIRAEIGQIQSTLNAVTDPKPGQLDYLTYRLERWQSRYDEIMDALAQLSDEERFEVLSAAEIIRGFRDRQFNDSGIHFGTGLTTPTTT